MLHKFDTRYPELCVVIDVNVSDEDVILTKAWLYVLYKRQI